MKRTIEKHIRFSEEEYEKVTEKAKALGVSPGKYIRRAAVENEVNHCDMKQLYKLKVSFDNVGNLFNQIAKVANSTQSVYRKDIEEMRNQIIDMREYLENNLPKIFTHAA